MPRLVLAGESTDGKRVVESETPPANGSALRSTGAIPLAERVADMIALWDSDRVLTAEQALSLAQYLTRIREVES